ncbi:hypothetical protein EVAR_16346_1 [Eumeta japonica]|uniref:DNA helicase Pif1-like 2B domain-containing protein n=1 Tax=Eumeta variegata TaxID=151549 RepID=A0A4C1VG64_EUMVA|nr:hypothetical protein EVAR_16346_1 [Eumeta japonica]
MKKTGELPIMLEIFVGAKVVLRYNIDVSEGLVNGIVGHITKIIWPCFQRVQMSTGIPSVRVDFDKKSVQPSLQLIQPKSIYYFQENIITVLLNEGYLPIILYWACTVQKVQGSILDHAVVYLGPKFYAAHQE